MGKAHGRRVCGRLLGTHKSLWRRLKDAGNPAGPRPAQDLHRFSVPRQRIPAVPHIPRADTIPPFSNPPLLFSVFRPGAATEGLPAATDTRAGRTQLGARGTATLSSRPRAPAYLQASVLYPPPSGFQRGQPRNQLWEGKLEAAPQRLETTIVLSPPSISKFPQELS